MIFLVVNVSVGSLLWRELLQDQARLPGRSARPQKFLWSTVFAPSPLWGHGVRWIPAGPVKHRTAVHGVITQPLLFYLLYNRSIWLVPCAARQAGSCSSRCPPAPPRASSAPTRCGCCGGSGSSGPQRSQPTSAYTEYQIMYMQRETSQKQHWNRLSEVLFLVSWGGTGRIIKNILHTSLK